MSESPRPVRLTLPATSANLGSAFDAAGLAMGLTLTVDAQVNEVAGAPELVISATGRDADRCSNTRNNLIFETYREVLSSAGCAILPLQLRLRNEIPLGMGCGSSAAALLAGVMLASHFGRLDWSLHTCMEEACRREGHPDNVAACALGYMTVSAETEGQRVAAVTCGQGIDWKLLLALPAASLATERARALLPAAYSRSEAVHNIQRSALLTGAFAAGRGDLLAIAMQDRIHQPYRSQVCPLLPKLLPLAGLEGILGVALSGAGPGVLLVAESRAPSAAVVDRIRQSAQDPGLEVLETRVAPGVVQQIS
jgi:homoserine kinase